MTMDFRFAPFLRRPCDRSEPRADRLVDSFIDVRVDLATRRGSKRIGRACQDEAPIPKGAPASREVAGCPTLLAMKLEILSLCKAAVVEHHALSILSAMDRLHAAKVPCVLPRCSVAVRLRFDRIEAGQHELKLQVVDADGRGVMNPLQAKLGVAFGEKDRTAAISLVIDINGLSLPSFGEYSIDLAVDAHHVGSIPFQLLEQKPS